ncbi:MAG: hypothetical protein KDA96_03710 [Planctomycetaceae bacterium]|nr:hypothetical protein [Planctomycetaceae bacterium]
MSGKTTIQEGLRLESRSKDSSPQQLHAVVLVPFLAISLLVAGNAGAQEPRRGFTTPSGRFIPAPEDLPPLEQPEASAEPAPAAAATSGHAAIPVITEDTVFAPFYPGPVPRSQPMAEDSDLHDFAVKGGQLWAVGDRGVVVSSADGGRTWDSSLLPTDASLRTVCFLTNQLGWVGGSRWSEQNRLQTAFLASTEDGGRSWTEITADGPRSDTSATGIPVSRLGGITHIQYFSLTDAVALAVPTAFSSEHLRPSVFRTRDGGKMWEPVETDQNAGLWTAAAFNGIDEGIVAGEQMSYATIIGNRAVTMGPPTGTPRRVRGVSLNADGSGWLAGDGAFLLKTDNAGVNWTTAPGALPDHLRNLLDFQTVAHHGEVVVAAGTPGSAIVRSDDNGRTWHVIHLPGSAPIRRIRFLSDQVAMAVGTFGTILFSFDAGHTWQDVRGSGIRAACLVLTTDAHSLPFHLMARNAADQGFRTVVTQMSSDVNDGGFRSRTDSDLARIQAVGAIGGNSADTDWMFDRTFPGIDQNPAALMNAWDIQTEGQLRNRLPERLARQIRMWRPSVIVIHRSQPGDAVAEILTQALPPAVRLAAGQGAVEETLDLVLPTPWTVQRTFVTAVPNHRTQPEFRDTDLLPRMATTSGLLIHPSRRILGSLADPVADSTSEWEVERYELLPGSDLNASPAGLMMHLKPFPGREARRSLTPLLVDEIDQIAEAHQRSQTESAALQGQMLMARTEDALIAELRSIGQGLPEDLALQQLTTLADRQRKSEQLESYIATLQEITRRRPDSPAGFDAAVSLYMIYSSAEYRRYRRDAVSSGRQRLSVPGGVVQAGGIDQDGGGSLQLIPGVPATLPPKVEPASATPFTASATPQLEALEELWDRQAASAWDLIQQHHPPDHIRQGLLFTNAAAERRHNRLGGAGNLMSEAARLPGTLQLAARAEMQLETAAPVSPLPSLLVYRTLRKPVLDARLNDDCWKDAQEIFLEAESGPSTNVAKTLVLLSRDEEFLYVAARCDFPPTRTVPQLVASERYHDADHELRDRLELTLDLDRDYSTAYQFTVDQTGQTSESLDHLVSWNPQWYVANDADSNGWRIEAAIPLSELASQRVPDGALWSVRLRRLIPGETTWVLGETDRIGGRLEGVGLARLVRPRTRK